jgi:hypothetical protein
MGFKPNRDGVPVETRGVVSCCGGRPNRRDGIRPPAQTWSSRFLVCNDAWIVPKRWAYLSDSEGCLKIRGSEVPLPFHEATV